MKSHPLGLVLACLLLTLACVPSRSAAQEPQAIDFAHDIVPILTKHCTECHGGENSKGGFSLNTRALVLDAEAVVPGKPAESTLLELVVSKDADLQMPPKDRPRVSEAEVALLRRWIEQDLKWEEGFTFARHRYEPPLRPRQVDLPPAVEGRTHAIDRILDAYVNERKLPHPAAIDDATFARRVYYDLVGLPPPVDRLQRFLTADDPHKRSALIDELLADNQAYATHWLAFWNDLLRNDYSGTGYIDGGRRQITGWLYASLLENKPFDQFTQELIAPPEATSAGFIGGIKWRGNVNASQTTEIQFAQSISQVFLGINMKCASCHDSFIDRWTLDEAYSLAAIYSNKPLEIYRCDKPTGEMATAAWIFPELGEIDPQALQPERLKQLAGLMTHPENGRFSRTIVNRIWHRLMGRGIVHPVDAMHTEPWSHDLLDYLAQQLLEEDYDLKAIMRLIVTSQAYQSQSVRLAIAPDESEFVYQGPLAKRLTAEEFVDSLSAITGVWPGPDGGAFKNDGRGQSGQLAAVLIASGEANSEQAADQNKLKALWGERPLRASLTRLDLLQATLGRPNREQIVSSRPPLLTTLEAITLANGPELAGLVEQGARQMLNDYGANSNQLLDYLYLAALSRLPSSEEQEIAGQILGPEPTQTSVEDLLWSVTMLPEFQLVR